MNDVTNWSVTNMTPEDFDNLPKQVVLTFNGTAKECREVSDALNAFMLGYKADDKALLEAITMIKIDNNID